MKTAPKPIAVHVLCICSARKGTPVWGMMFETEAFQACYILCFKLNHCMQTIALTDCFLSFVSSTLSQSVFASRPRYLSGLGCSGSESSLLSCPYTSPPGTVCAGGNGVRLICEQPPTGDQCTHSLVLSDTCCCSYLPNSLGSVILPMHLGPIFEACLVAINSHVGNNSFTAILTGERWLLSSADGDISDLKRD